MVSQCRSAKRALIRVRLLCVPPVASPPGDAVVAALPPCPETVTPGAAEVACALETHSCAPDACAGANNMNAVGLVILSADIAMSLGVNVGVDAVADWCCCDRLDSDGERLSKGD